MKPVPERAVATCGERMAQSCQVLPPRGDQLGKAAPSGIAGRTKVEPSQTTPQLPTHSSNAVRARLALYVAGGALAFRCALKLKRVCMRILRLMPGGDFALSGSAPFVVPGGVEGVLGGRVVKRLAPVAGVRPAGLVVGDDLA